MNARTLIRWIDERESGVKKNLVFAIDENEKRARGLFGHARDHESYVILCFFCTAQYYSFTVAHKV